MNRFIEKTRKLGTGAVNAVKKFWNDEDGMGTVEVILIIVGICTPQKRRILCGNFRYRS